MSVTLSVLAMSFCFAFGTDNVGKTNISEIYKATSISEYYNLIADIPVKFINNLIIKKYFKQEKKQSNKNDTSKSSNTNYENLFVICNAQQNLREFNLSSGSCDTGKELPLYCSQNGGFAIEYGDTIANISSSYVNNLFFNITLHLARGDTSDIIINNKYKQILKFCLL